MNPSNDNAADARRYVIHVAGHLDDRWSDAFDGKRLVREPDGTTSIDCPHIDQAALHGLLRRIRDAGLPLISVTRLPADS